MTQLPSQPSTARVTDELYRQALHAVDEAVCEALAVSQAAAGRQAPQHQILATKIFARICAHATAFMRAVPLSRWSRSEWTPWEFSDVAGHARAILEGVPLFAYIAAEPQSDGEWAAKLWLMHLCDCTKRIQLAAAGYFVSSSDLQGYETHAADLRQKLQGNAHFATLTQAMQNRLLKGKHMMLLERSELLRLVGADQEQYNSLYDVLSHYTHILPMSFYRMEENGRGTGLENEVDRAYIFLSASVVSALVSGATDDMVQMFPDTASSRRGTTSFFSPGPAANAPPAMRAQVQSNRRRPKSRQRRR